MAKNCQKAKENVIADKEGKSLEDVKNNQKESQN